MMTFFAPLFPEAKEKQTNMIQKATDNFLRFHFLSNVIIDLIFPLGDNLVPFSPA